MSKVNQLISLLSLTAVLIIIERLSFTTKIILQPYSYLRVHEVFQMGVLTSISVIISFFLLKVLSKNFELLKNAKGTILGIIFILGLYFTATGNGAHEIASHIFNTFCNTKLLQNGMFLSNNVICGSAFFNDYYFGNIVYFLGLLLGNVSLILFEVQNPDKKVTKKDTIITIVNGLIYAFMLFAYGAFDPVLVGMWFSILSAIVSGFLLFTAKTKITNLPFTLYMVIGSALSAIGILLYRFQ